MIEEDILELIEKYEKKKIEYLEVDDKRSANRYIIKIERLQKDLQLLNIKKIEKELEVYKKFIAYRGLQNEFIAYRDVIQYAE